MGNPLRALIVEDSEVDASLLVRELQRGGYDVSFKRVCTPETLNEALDQQTWDITFCDYSMPNFNGGTALKMVRERGLDTPFIFVSGTIAEDTAVHAMKNGANDYIIKGNVKRLLPAIERELREAEIRKAHKQAQERIQHMAFYDTLTELPNRNRLNEYLVNSIHTDTAKTQRFALLLLDLNHFKDINDTIGLDQGDEVLKEVGWRLREAMFERGIVARLGGDEFGLLLTMEDGNDIKTTIQKLNKTLEKSILVGSLPIRVESGIGVALYPDHGTEAGTLFKRADIALQISKRTGISYVVYDPAQDKQSPQRLSLMSELHHAIEHDELALHYQPKIDMKTKTIVGVEALVRWKHPVRGLIPPDQFILPAEQSGLIHPLTQWVLNSAMIQCKAWREEGVALAVAINLSVRNLMNLDLPDQVVQLIQAHGINPDWLIFEITESAIMSDPARAHGNLLKLNDMGIRLSIDDFGTGYTSLSYLTKLPVKEIKIDRSFVMDMIKNKSAAVIVRAVIDLTHNLGLKVTAEGVEEREHWDQLEMWGCEEMQGYYMCKPLSVQDLTCWLKESPWGLKNND